MAAMSIPRGGFWHGPLGLLLLSALALGLVACSSDDPAVRISGEHEGVVLTADVRATDHSLVAEALVRNDRPEAAYLGPDQCGRVIDAEGPRHPCLDR